MLMLCWFYCIPFAKFLYFAFGPFFFLCAMFALKRGIRNQRRGLRQASFIMMFVAVAKVFIFDIGVPDMAENVKAKACAIMPGLAPLECHTDGAGHIFLQVVGGVIFAVMSYAIWEYYKIFMPDKKPKDTTPEQVHLRFWANSTFISVLVMIAWQLAPWVGYLTVGCIPGLFIRFTWQQLALVSVGMLLHGFWKLESCVWQYKVSEKERMKYMQSTWTPKDTLWMTVFLYLVTLALSYVAHDIMVHTQTVPVACRSGEAKQNMDENNDITPGSLDVSQ